MMILYIALCDDEAADLLQEKKLIELVLPNVSDTLKWEIDTFLSSEDMLNSSKIYNMVFLLEHICEFLLLAYFANTSFYPRKNYLLSNVISLCGYILLCGIGLLGKAPVSICIVNIM